MNKLKNIKEVQLNFFKINYENKNNRLPMESYATSKKKKYILDSDKHEELESKERASKKTRLKKKFINAIDTVEKLKNIKSPKFIIDSIKKAKLELIDLNLEDQKSILELTEKLKKNELAILLLLIPNTMEELKFVKEIIFKKQYIDNLFSSINYKSIDKF